MKRMSKLVIVIVITTLCAAASAPAQVKPNPPDLNALAAKGEALSEASTLTVMLRDRQPYATRRGFYIGMAVAEVDTEEGPGKDRIGSSLSLDEQSGFIIAVSFSLMRNRNAKLAVIGEAIKLSDPTIAAAREVHMDAFFRLGFDIATAIFGDPAQGAVGNTQPGPWSMKIRDSLLIGRRGGQMAQQGFDDSMKLHLNPPTKWDGLVATGEALAGQDPLTMLLRDQTLGGLLKRGFYIGLALGEKDTEPGKGKDKVRDSLSSTEQMGFVMALNFSLARNRNAKLAATGAAIAAADASIAGLRNLQPNAFYRLGFDVATALFGPPALGSQGNTLMGAGSLRIRDSLLVGKDGFVAQAGFDDSVKFHLRRRRSPPPSP